MMHGKKNIKCC